MAEEAAAAETVAETTETPAVEETAEPTPASDEHWTRNHDFTDDQIGIAQNKGWDGPAAMLSSYMELEKFRGVDEDHLLKIPAADDADGQKVMFQRLGTPEDVEGYKFAFDESTQIDEEFLGRFKTAALDNNMSAEAAQNMALWWNQENTQFQEAQAAAEEQQAQKDMADLKIKWGVKTEERLDYGRRAAKAMGMDDDQIAGIQQNIGGVATAEFFAKMADLMGEDKVSQGSGEPGFGTSREQVRTSIKKILGELSGDADRMAKYRVDKANPKGLVGKDFLELDKLYEFERSLIREEG